MPAVAVPLGRRASAWCDTRPVARHGLRALIGVTAYRQAASWGPWERDAALVPGTYLDVIEAAGGQPLVIPSSSDGVNTSRRMAERVVGCLDGLVLIGGGDLEPTRYRQRPHPRTSGLSPARDELELALVDAALERPLPLLAVCRGMQVLNVALGGDLVQHLPEQVGSDHHQPRPGSFAPVAVTTERGSVVHEVLGDRLTVFCSHHQAIATLGRGLVATATAEDGVVEAVELPGLPFAVGVQWHPEESGDVRLFEALVASSSTAMVER